MTLKKIYSVLLFALLFQMSFGQDKTAFDFQLKGNALADKGNYSDAMHNYNQAIEIYKSKNDGTHWLGKCYYYRANCKSQLEDYRGAINDYNSAILAWDYGKIPNEALYPSIYYYRGICKNLINDIEGGCQDWSKAGELGYTKAYQLIRENCN
ncbi:MAG: hypothetical protein M3Q58_03240 [Bacteroidota bacterium]|nr:hypothetical protein [Bacteroidota bacterium]